MPKNEDDIRGDMKQMAHQVHDAVIKATGGTPGIRYDADLERATSFLDLAERVAVNHPYVDGNKRTAFTIYMIHYKMMEATRKYRTDMNGSLLSRPDKLHVLGGIIEAHIDWLNILAKI